MKSLFLGAAIAAACLTTSAKAETINCTEITTIPTVITAQGIYCLKHDLSSSVASGRMIDIQTNNVTVDLNGFKLGGLGAGPMTAVFGISGVNRQNITIRNGSIRGFLRGIALHGSGHLIENVLLDTSREIAIDVEGTDNVIRNNRVVNTGTGGSVDSAFGIVVIGRNAVVADNIVSGTSETATAEGILTQATLVEVRNNTVLATKDATKKIGIRITGSADVTVIGNRVLNAASESGTEGISSSGSTGVYCISNTIAGFTAAFTGCNLDSGNITPEQS